MHFVWLSLGTLVAGTQPPCCEEANSKWMVWMIVPLKPWVDRHQQPIMWVRRFYISAEALNITKQRETLPVVPLNFWPTTIMKDEWCFLFFESLSFTKICYTKLDNALIKSIINDKVDVDAAGQIFIKMVT